ncbi:hypothetical protein [Larkinella sp. C7]|uniref:hypothetical protein n=1 Tax=Larkinella sp. C7 TaxID=2576607 RepID=UPI001111406C|nr:hypothetical protein [Larkinella sp. C7]
MARFRTDVHDLIDENNALNDSSFTRRLKNNLSYNITISSTHSGAALRGDGPNSYVLKGMNLEKDHTFFITGFIASTIRWWNTSNTITLTRSQSIDHQYGFELVKPRPQFYAYTSNTFTTKDLFKIQ